MALTVGVNSWASVAEADAYLETKAGSEMWFYLDDAPATPGADSKETFLVSAFFWLFDDKSFGLSAALTDDKIKRAQIEAALFLMTYRTEFENRQAMIASGVSSFRNSKWSENLGSVNKPQNILDILASAGFSFQNGVVQLLPEDYS